MSAKPKLAILPVGKKNQYLGDLHEFIRYYRKVFSGDDSPELVMDEEILFDESDIVSAAKRAEGEGADLILFVVGTWIFSSHVISVY